MKFNLSHNQKALSALVLILILILTLVVAPAPDRRGARLVIDPTKTAGQAGQTWTVKVLVQANQPVNSIDTTLKYPADLVQVGSVSVDNADFNMIVFKPVVDAKAGTIHIVQTSLQPYLGSAGLVATITLKGYRQGPVNLTPTQTKIIAHDGTGDNVYRPSLKQSLGRWLLSLVGIGK